MKEDTKVELSEKFALKIVECYKFLCDDKHEYVMSKQLLRAGTSIGANIAESLCSESESDFIHKLTISQKEASETKYWLKLLYRSGYLPESLYIPIANDCNALLRVITSIILSMKKRNRTN